MAGFRADRHLGRSCPLERARSPDPAELRLLRRCGSFRFSIGRIRHSCLWADASEGWLQAVSSSDARPAPAKLYLVQIALVACSIAIPLAAAKAVGDEGLELGQGLSRFVASPVSSLVGAVSLAYQPNFADILALYVVLMLWAPVIVFLASRSSALALLVSIAVYIAGRGRVGAEGDGWFFNPFAWQLLFAIGVICALRWRSGLPRPRRWLVASLWPSFLAPRSCR